MLVTYGRPTELTLNGSDPIKDLYAIEVPKENHANFRPLKVFHSISSFYYPEKTKATLNKEKEKKKIINHLCFQKRVKRKEIFKCWCV